MELSIDKLKDRFSMEARGKVIERGPLFRQLVRRGASIEGMAHCVRIAKEREALYGSLFGTRRPEATVRTDVVNTVFGFVTGGEVEGDEKLYTGFRRSDGSYVVSRSRPFKGESNFEVSYVSSMDADNPVDDISHTTVKVGNRVQVGRELKTSVVIAVFTFEGKGHQTQVIA